MKLKKRKSLDVATERVAEKRLPLAKDHVFGKFDGNKKCRCARCVQGEAAK
jgi:hypothetical protein